MTAREKACMAANLLDQKKARDVKILHVGDITVLTDYFVICTGNVAAQLKALADELDEKMGSEIIKTEGYNSAKWILVDMGDVTVHIFDDETRAFYQLEWLWADAKAVEFETEE